VPNDVKCSKIDCSVDSGYLESLDDYYQLSSGLVMLQTTNQIFHLELYDGITPRSLFAWQRVLVANMMANSGLQWYNTVRMYNSGMMCSSSGVGGSSSSTSSSSSGGDGGSSSSCSSTAVVVVGVAVVVAAVAVVVAVVVVVVVAAAVVVVVVLVVVVVR